MAVGERHPLSVGGGCPWLGAVVPWAADVRARLPASAASALRSRTLFVSWGSPRRRAARRRALSRLVPGVTTCGVGRPRAPSRTSWDRGRGASIKSPRSPRRARDGAVPRRPTAGGTARGGRAASQRQKTCTHVAPRADLRACRAILTRAPSVMGTAPFWRRARVD